MFDKERFKFALENYKKDFPTWFEEEKYKWEAVKCFQDNWNVDAKNFEGMLRRSLSKVYNLLSSTNYFPALMITEFAKRIPEKTRAMFVELLDESQNLYKRIENFKNTSDILLKEYVADPQSKYRRSATKHHQDERAMSVYLWLRYPEKYYIYKFTEVKDFSNFLQSSYIFKKGAYTDNIKSFYKFYDEVCVAIREDIEFVKVFESQLTELCYSDSESKILTGDFGYYVSKNFDKLFKNLEQIEEWYPRNYNPNLTVEDWKKTFE